MGTTPTHGELNGCTADGGDGTAVGLAAAHNIIEIRTGDGRLTPIGTTSSFETKDPGPRGLASHSAVCSRADAVAWIGATVPAEESGQFQPGPPTPLSSRRGFGPSTR